MGKDGPGGAGEHGRSGSDAVSPSRRRSWSSRLSGALLKRSRTASQVPQEATWPATVSNWRSGRSPRPKARSRSGDGQSPAERCSAPAMTASLGCSLLDEVAKLVAQSLQHTGLGQVDGVARQPQLRGDVGRFAALDDHAPEGLPGRLLEIAA